VHRESSVSNRPRGFQDVEIRPLEERRIIIGADVAAADDGAEFIYRVINAAVDPAEEQRARARAEDGRNF